MMEAGRTPLCDKELSRRRFLRAGLYGAASVASGLYVPAFAKSDREIHEPFFKTRGVVLTTPDLSTLDWPQRAARAERSARAGCA